MSLARGLETMRTTDFAQHTGVECVSYDRGLAIDTNCLTA